VCVCVVLCGVFVVCLLGYVKRSLTKVVDLSLDSRKRDPREKKKTVDKRWQHEVRMGENRLHTHNTPKKSASIRSTTRYLQHF